MFKQQARYLIKRRETDLWAQVLVHDIVRRRALIDQVRLSISRLQWLTMYLDCRHSPPGMHWYATKVDEPAVWSRLAKAQRD